MANSAVLSFEHVGEIEEPRDATRTPLADVAVGHPVRVIALALDEELAAWLRAVGIGEGDVLVVLRRAAFGGPMHVRTGSGGEFALNRSLARAIATRPEREGEREHSP